VVHSRDNEGVGADHEVNSIKISHNFPMGEGGIGLVELSPNKFQVDSKS